VPKNSIDSYPRSGRSMQVVAGLAATATLLAGCATHKTGEPKPKHSHGAASAAPSTTETTTFSAISYDTNPQRNAKISKAVKAFGTIVLEQYNEGHGPWGPLDGFCSPGTTLGSYNSGSSNEGWLAQGYKPTAGQNCYLQHNSQYGNENMQIGADVVTGTNGVFTNEFVAANVNNSTCATIIIDNGSNLGQKLGWNVQIGTGAVSASNDAELATSLAQAETIDNQALACLAETRP
jgi:hypothetical protein